MEEETEIITQAIGLYRMCPNRQIYQIRKTTISEKVFKKCADCGRTPKYKITEKDQTWYYCGTCEIGG
jgi:hypothetical protein